MRVACFDISKRLLLSMGKGVSFSTFLKVLKRVVKGFKIKADEIVSQSGRYCASKRATLRFKVGDIEKDIQTDSWRAKKESRSDAMAKELQRWTDCGIIRASFFNNMEI